MASMRKLIFVLLLSLGLCSCDPLVVEKTSETLSRGVYAAADALSVGNVPLASQYLDNVEKLVPAPKNRIKITPIYANGIGYVILGDNLSGKKVVIVGSNEFNDLVKAKVINSKLQADADKYNKEAAAQAKKNQDAITAVVQENQKLKSAEQKWHSSIFYKAYLFFTTLTYIVPLSIVGLIIACILCPALTAPAMALLGTLAGFALNFINGFFSFLGSLFTKKN
jgi:hypothetical protein